MVLWQAGVGGLGGNRLVMRNDGNLVIYRYAQGERENERRIKDDGDSRRNDGEAGSSGVSDGRPPVLEIIWASGTTGDNADPSVENCMAKRQDLRIL